MKFKTLLNLNVVLAVASGFACLFIPVQILANYGVTLIPFELIIYQLWGATLIGFGLFIRTLRNTKVLKMQMVIVLSLFFANGLCCFFSIHGQFAGANIFGWSTVALYSLLMLSYAIFVFANIRNTNKLSSVV